MKMGLDDVAISPGSSGQFDVTIDGALVFSRKTEGRFPEDAEVERWVEGMEQKPG